MPYQNNEELPDAIKTNLPADGQTIYREAFNAAMDKGANDADASKAGWAAVENAGYAKGDDGKWTKQAASQFEAELQGREIFSAGTWNGDTYTVEDLQEMADNFERLAAEVKPPLKLGHRDMKGQPALGWIKRVYRVGKKLVADFHKIPDVVKKAIDAGGYRRVSAEIFPVFKAADGKTYKNVLAAIALLGAETPAVSNLADLAKLYGAALPDGSGDGVKVYELTQKEIDEGQETKTKTGDNKMDDKIKEFEAKIKVFESELADQKKAVETVTKERDDALAKVKEFETKAESAAIEGHKAAFKKWLDDKVKAAEMTPAAAKVYEKHMDDMITPDGVVMKFEVVQEADKAAKDAKLDRKEYANRGKGKDAGMKTLDHHVKKYMAEHQGVDYETATGIILGEHPDLADAYLDGTNVVVDED